MATEEEVQSFLTSPLVRWVGSLLPGQDMTWLILARGVSLANLLEGLDSNFQIEVDAEPIDTASRAKNLLNLLRSIKFFYKEILGQLLLISLPSPRDLSQVPPSTGSLASMETLLLLVLGVAVQSEQKQDVIITIKNLPLDTQHDIVDRIRAITENPSMVWNRELCNPTTLGDDQRDEMYCLLVDHAKRLISQRDEMLEDLSTIRLQLDTKQGIEANQANPVTTASNHAMVEMAESKAKLRKLRQQLEEKTEQLAECKEELEKVTEVTTKVKAENLELCQDARAAKTYRDELDMMKERAEKVDKLEAEILRYKDKMNDIEFFKSRVEELREDNRILVETKDMLEEQLVASRKRCEAVLALENDIIKFKGDIERLQHEREKDRTKMKELLDENNSLTFSHKTSMSESQSLLAEMEAMKNQGSKDINLLSEQLGKDAVSRVHRLELENNNLKQELESTRTELAKKDKQKSSELEQEMRKSNMTVAKLEEQCKRDAESFIKAEKEMVELKQEYRTLEATQETLNEQFNLLQIERDTEVEALNKQISSLTSRASSSEAAQLNSLQEENRKLVSERTVLKTQLSKSSHEKERMERGLETAKTRILSLETVETEKSKMEQENKHLVEEMEKYTEIQDKNEGLQEELSTLSTKLKEHNENLEQLNTENMKLRVENQKLGRRVESIRNENQNKDQLEQEKEALKQTIAQMRTTISTLQKGQTKHDELELKVMSLTNENSRLEKQLSSLNTKFEDLHSENTEIETENKKMQKTIETLKVTVRRVNQLENENLDLEGIHHKVERENKSLVREIERLKQALDVKDLSLDNSTAKLNQTERELQKIIKEKESSKSNEAKIQELEASNADLASQCLADKKALLDLREELVKEKMAADQMANQLDQVNNQMAAFKDVNISKGLVKNSVASFEKGKPNKSQDSQDRVSVLQAERDQLSSELARLRVAAVGSEDKESAWMKKISSAQEEIIGLSKEKASLQVENRTLQSQSSSLLDQINSLQADYAKLEVELTKAAGEARDSSQETNQILEDQTRLQTLHGQLQIDYDKLNKEREELKVNERNLRNEITKLRERISNLTQGQDDVIRAKEALDKEKETFNMDKKTLANLRSEHSRLKDDFRSLFTANERMKTEYCNLQTDYKTLKTENNQLKLKSTEMAGQLGDVKEQLTLLDVENSKITNRCEVLHQLNLSLEEDRKSLMSQVSLLLYQYHELLTQTLDDKEHFHEEERGYTDKMNNLRRQKEKLEEKIMEQYKKMDNTTPKKKGLGFTLVKRMKKAGSNMFLASPSAGRGGIGGGGLSSIDGRRRGGGDEDTSSLGSGGNDSLDSGGRSPSESMMNTEHDKLLFRRSLPASMLGITGSGDGDGEEEGHNADNESLASYFSNIGYEGDHIPTRDTGPGGRDFYRDRDFDNRDYDYPEFTKDETGSYIGSLRSPILGGGGGSLRSPVLGGGDELRSPVPNTPNTSRKSSENQPRSISRVYLSASGEVVGGGRTNGSRNAEPRLTGWKKTGDEDSSLPPLPSRRAPTPPPNRPPKPRGSSPSESEKGDEDKKEKDTNSENSVWYEYGCV